MPSSECSGYGAEFTLPLSPSLEPDVNISEATLVNVAEDSLLGYKEAADDISENVTESGNEASSETFVIADVSTVPIIPASEGSVCGLLVVSTLGNKTKAQSTSDSSSEASSYTCLVWHSDKSVCKDNESSSSIKVNKSKSFYLKNPCPEPWPPDPLILVFGTKLFLLYSC